MEKLICTNCECPLPRIVTTVDEVPNHQHPLGNSQSINKE